MKEEVKPNIFKKIGSVLTAIILIIVVLTRAIDFFDDSDETSTFGRKYGEEEVVDNETGKSNEGSNQTQKDNKNINMELTKVYKNDVMAFSFDYATVVGAHHHSITGEEVLEAPDGYVMLIITGKIKNISDSAINVNTIKGSSNAKVNGKYNYKLDWGYETIDDVAINHYKFELEPLAEKELVLRALINNEVGEIEYVELSSELYNSDNPSSIKDFKTYNIKLEFERQEFFTPEYTG